jgi:hypothetical protein
VAGSSIIIRPASGKFAARTNRRDPKVEQLILAGADQNFDALWLIIRGEILIDVAFPIGNDADAGCAGRRKTGGTLGTVEPAAAFLLCEGLLLAPPGLAAVAREEVRIAKSQKRTFDHIDRDGGMQSNAAPLVFGAQRYRVLNGKHMAGGNTRQGARRRGFDHFVGCNDRRQDPARLETGQERFGRFARRLGLCARGCGPSRCAKIVVPRLNPGIDLARAVCAKPAHLNPPLATPNSFAVRSLLLAAPAAANRNRRSMQEDPPAAVAKPAKRHFHHGSPRATESPLQ